MVVLHPGSAQQMNWTPSSISARHAIVATMMVQRCNTYKMSMLKTRKTQYSSTQTLPREQVMHFAVTDVDRHADGCFNNVTAPRSFA